MELKRLSVTEGRERIKGAQPLGYFLTVASGEPIQSYQVDGGRIEHYLDFGWIDKFLFVPDGYIAPQSVPYRRGWC